MPPKGFFSELPRLLTHKPNSDGPGQLPGGSRLRWAGGSAADQFSQDPASGARVVAIPGGDLGYVDPGVGEFSCALLFEAHCRHGHPKASSAILCEKTAPTSEQLAATAKKHL